MAIWYLKTMRNAFRFPKSNGRVEGRKEASCWSVRKRLAEVREALVRVPMEGEGGPEDIIAVAWPRVKPEFGHVTSLPSSLEGKLPVWAQLPGEVAYYLQSPGENSMSSYEEPLGDSPSQRWDGTRWHSSQIRQGRSAPRVRALTLSEILRTKLYTARLFPRQSKLTKARAICAQINFLWAKDIFMLV
jgi:hypothetical protein